MKKLLAILLSLALFFSMTALVSCGDENELESKSASQTDDESDSAAELTTEQKLTIAVKGYLASEKFAADVSGANTTQARLPLSYIKYVNADVLPETEVAALETYLGYVEKLLGEDGKIDESKFDTDEMFGEKTAWGSYVRWQSVLDYAFSYSLFYNQYKYATGGAESKFDGYVGAISEYVVGLDTKIGKGEISYIGTAWGFDMASEIYMTEYNLGETGKTPVSELALLNYYITEEGKFTAPAPQPNWNGFTGRPLAASLLTSSDAYSAEYETTMQGYYPKAALGDNYSPTVDLLVTLKELADNYTVTLGEYETYDPEFAILTAFAHGINVDKAVEKWLASVETDGGYTVDNLADFAVATAYIAKANGINNPTPLGAYNAENKVITVE